MERSDLSHYFVVLELAALDVAASAAYVKIYSSQTNGSTILSGNDEVDECRRRRRKARFPSSMTK